MQVRKRTPMRSKIVRKKQQNLTSWWFLLGAVFVVVFLATTFLSNPAQSSGYPSHPTVTLDRFETGAKYDPETHYDDYTERLYNEGSWSIQAAADGIVLIRR